MRKHFIYGIDCLGRKGLLLPAVLAVRLCSAPHSLSLLLRGDDDDVLLFYPIIFIIQTDRNKKNRLTERERNVALLLARFPTSSNQQTAPPTVSQETSRESWQPAGQRKNK